MGSLEEKDIIIAGGGFAGVNAALTISRLAPDRTITLINDTPYHTYNPDLYEVLSAILPKDRKIDYKNLRGTTNIPLKELFRNSNVQLVKDSIKSIFLQERRVETSGQFFSYHYLVLALGSLTNYFHIQGAEAHGHPLKTTEDALNIRNDLEEIMFNSTESVSIAVAGGGFTGVEVAGALVGYLGTLAERYQKPRAKVSIVGSGSHVLEGMDAWAQKTAEKKLRKLKVDLVLNHRIASIDDKFLHSTDNDTVPYDYVIWATGIKANFLDNSIHGAPLSDKGRLLIEPDLSLKGYPEVFTAGDMSGVTYNDAPVPATGHAAMEQGHLVGLNLKQRLDNKPPKYYAPDPSIFVVPIGKKFAVSNPYGFRVVGILGWGLKKLVSLKYLSSIMSVEKAIALWWKGVKIYNTSD